MLAYFLGGIVPLVGLILVARRYAAEALLEPALAGVILSIALLSLASFLLLQRTTRQALNRATRDNRRLAELIDSSQALAGPVAADEVLDLALGSASALTNSPAAYFVAVRGDGAHLTVRAARGPESDAVFQRHSAEIHELAALAMPASRAATSPTDRRRRSASRRRARSAVPSCWSGPKEARTTWPRMERSPLSRAW